MLGLGFGWEITWTLLPDGRVVKRTAFTQQLQGGAGDRADGDLSASYRDEVVPWDQVPREIRAQFDAMRREVLHQDASDKEG